MRMWRSFDRKEGEGWRCFGECGSTACSIRHPWTKTVATTVVFGDVGRAVCSLKYCCLILIVDCVFVCFLLYRFTEAGNTYLILLHYVSNNQNNCIVNLDMLLCAG